MSMVFDEITKKRQNEVLGEIRSIVGSKSFQFSEAYVRKVNPCVGEGERPYSTITKKYLYVSCWLEEAYNDDGSEFGARIKKFPIYYRMGSGKRVNKIPIEDLFTEDLEEILKEIKFFLWWEVTIRLPKIKAEFEEASKFGALFDKLLNSYEPSEEEMLNKNMN